MPLWVGDFLSSASCAELSGEEQALYLLLLVHCWNMGERGLPADTRDLARLVRYNFRTFSTHFQHLFDTFYVRDKRLFHTRVDEELAKVKEKSKKASASASIRWEARQRLKLLGAE